MNGFQSRQRSLQFQFLLFSIATLFDSGLANDPPSPKNGNKASSSSSSGSVALKAVIVLLGVAAVLGFCVFLFKIWQKKKREEQHARLLKLFEDDDELEVELGIRD
ncbi:hypothetical protein PRUPE_1G549500 [Prunus persica]|uniref:Transmembrane protein n=2 Tax=Prunus TaxID=3754 RepID=A0A251RI76_PRUPE|nr:hypothetical protein L3X38_008892 [Prunus dulcis]ONI35672.1 hypothetical protein PRUPE_1G549500 [Prunus persica]ONI35673.1 hypothetical protein PRUPE_1G549500 [Prunus persica]VVA19682.1 PREDICTED: transmembrane [Prunus dulcis]